MAFLAQESRGLMAADGEMPEDGPMALPLRRRARQGWSLGKIVFGLLGVAALGGIAARASKGTSTSLRGEKAFREVEVLDEAMKVGLVGALSEPQDADADTQDLVDGFKADAQRMLTLQGWDLDFEPFEAQSYCSQVVAGTSYVVKVSVGGGEKALQLSIFKPLPVQGDAASATATLTTAAVVAADDKSCKATPLAAPMPMMYSVQDADASIQTMIEGVKDKVGPLLESSGWANVPLSKYTALSYCSDGMDYVVQVGVETRGDGAQDEALPPAGLVLELLVREPSDVEKSTSGAKVQLFGALMVTPLPGSCAALPVLPQKSLALPDAKALLPSVAPALPDAKVPLPSVAPALPEAKAPEVDDNATDESTDGEDEPQRLLEEEVKSKKSKAVEKIKEAAVKVGEKVKQKVSGEAEVASRKLEMPDLPKPADLPKLPELKPLELLELPKIPELKPADVPKLPELTSGRAREDGRSKDAWAGARAAEAPSGKVGGR